MLRTLLQIVVSTHSPLHFPWFEVRRSMLGVRCSHSSFWHCLGKQGTNSERPTLNIERRTGLLAALLLSLLSRLDAAHKNTDQLIGLRYHSASTKRGRSMGTRWISNSQRQDSRRSLRQILSFCTKSLADSTACASPWFGGGDVPDRILSEELSRRGWEESDLATRWRSDPGKVAIAARV